MKQKNINLTNDDLRNNKFKYNTDQIIYNIQQHQISFIILIKTQQITPYIAVKYIVNGGIDGDYIEENGITVQDIIYYQSHITVKDMIEAYNFVIQEDNNEVKELNNMSKHDKI